MMNLDHARRVLAHCEAQEAAKTITAAELRRHALELADEAAVHPDYHRRRELEQEALSLWRKARQMRRLGT